MEGTDSTAGLALAPHELLRAFNAQTLARGETLYSVGDDPNAMFGLEEGFLDLAIPIAADEEVVIHRAPPGPDRWRLRSRS